MTRPIRPPKIVARRRYRVELRDRGRFVALVLRVDGDYVRAGILSGEVKMKIGHAEPGEVIKVFVPGATWQEIEA